MIRICIITYITTSLKIYFKLKFKNWARLMFIFQIRNKVKNLLQDVNIIINNEKKNKKKITKK